MIRRLRTGLAAALPATMMIAGCSGGNHATPSLPSAVPSAAATAKAGYAQVVLKISSPPRARVGAAFARRLRLPKYVSPASYGGTVSVNGQNAGPVTCEVQDESIIRRPQGAARERRPQQAYPQAPLNFLSCTATVQAPFGNDTFSVTLTDGSSNVLSVGTLSNYPISPNQVNVVPIALQGVAAYVVPFIGCEQAGYFASTVPLAILDADLQEISGPDLGGQYYFGEGYYPGSGPPAGTFNPANLPSTALQIANPFTLQLTSSSPSVTLQVGTAGTPVSGTTPTGTIDGTQEVFINYPSAASGVGTPSATATLVGTPAAGSAPTVLLPQYASQLAFVTMTGSNEEYLSYEDLIGEIAVSGSSGTECGTIPLDTGDSAQGIAVSDDGKTLFIAAPYNSSIDIINLATGTFNAVVDPAEGGLPNAVGYDHHGGDDVLFVADGTNTLEKIANPTTCSLTSSCAVSTNPGLFSSVYVNQGSSSNTYGIALDQGDVYTIFASGDGAVGGYGLPSGGEHSFLDGSGAGYFGTTGLAASGGTLYVLGNDAFLNSGNGGGALFTISETGGDTWNEQPITPLVSSAFPSGPQAVAVLNSGNFYVAEGVSGLFQYNGGSFNAVSGVSGVNGVAAVPATSSVWATDAYSTQIDVVQGTLLQATIPFEESGLTVSSIAFGAPFYTLTLTSAARSPQTRR